jgi:hypothetical protein
MIEARINLGVLNTMRRRIRIWINQFDSGARSCNTSRAPVSVYHTFHVFRREDAHVVIACIGS